MVTLCPKPQAKALRLSGRKRVTLIVTWRCKGAIVICADSQETVGDFRLTRQKITPEQMGKFQVIVAGSGPGDLIDSFALRLQRRLRSSQFTDIATFVDETEDELAAFYGHDVVLSPLAESDKNMKLTIAAACPETGAYGAWFTQNVRLQPIQGYDLSGHEATLYDALARRFYRPEISIAQAVLAGVYVLSVAESSSAWVGGPMSVAVILPYGIWMEASDYIEEMEGRLKDYEQKINQVLLSSADTSISVHALQQQLASFSETVISLHRQHIDRNVRRLTVEKLMKTDDAYPKHPRGAVINLGTHGFSIEHDPEKNRQEFERLREISEKATQNCDLVEHLVIRINADKYSLTLTGRIAGTTKKPPEELGEKTRAELLGYLAARKLFVFDNPESLLTFLATDGQEMLFYELRPKQSASQT